MLPNIITLVRILLSFFVVVLFQGNFEWRISAVVLTIVVIYLDSLDGIVARKLGESSDFGALFDITGDRIVEHVFWIFFTFLGLVSVWVPIIFISRSFLIDTLRTVAFSVEGKTPFGEKSMMRSHFTHFLTASRFSRAVYGGAKVVVFVFLGIIVVSRAEDQQLISMFPANFLQNFILVTNILVWIAVALNLVRGLPVLWDGKEYLFNRQYPKEFRKTY